MNTDDPETVPDATVEPPRFHSVDELLAAARQQLVRLDVLQARAVVAEGAMFVDIRPAWQRAHEGEIAGSLVVERNHLEWRLDQRSDAHVTVAETVAKWIVVCSEGYTSSLAAASLRSLGIDATDLIGGVRAWHEAGGSLVAGITPADSVVAEGTSWSSSEPDDADRLGAPTRRRRH